jgi:hypothetical protein
MIRYLLYLSICIVFFGCQKNREINRSIYHWKTTFDPSNEEIQFLNQHRINTLYLRFFDVKAENGSVVPVAKVHFTKPIPKEMTVIPVVYITNESILKTPENEIDTLAYNIHRLLRELTSGVDILFSELQIDCDWTDQSRERYFHLLKTLKTITRTKISATIRLHQIKYQDKTGVPPIDKGMLMFYNMGNLRDIETRNSIFESATAKKYLERGLHYPLPLDLALACFQWEVVLRQGKVIALLKEPISADLTQKHLIKINEELSQVRNNFLHQGRWFQNGDIIRTEKSGYKEISIAQELLKDRFQNTKFNLAIYHWQPLLFRELTHEKTDRIYSALQ